MPGKERVSGDQAMLFLGSIRERLAIVTLNEAEYVRAIEEAAALGVAGGGIYDAMLAHCALKATARTIYTWNLKHFQRLGPAIASRLKTP